ncbi:hypothetical protein [Sinimarinibacterium sp. NLF-5-8]|uniref:AAA family ATPase n=1 Tax=Sinimarinibacterium sp. NLF-5-8 TaxID=2698684 RepID=UPI00137B9EF1|nr:hypothetical protein [Sinimarinibacterium sp. NLF-5-8]QHS09313.1 hypothetical protein GT972_03515 [Sinimarinibacterium sp. NLF-5-8]
MKNLAIVVADDPVYLSWLENAAGDATEFSLVRALDAEDLLERVQLMGRIDVAFFQFEIGNLESRLSMVERLSERMPDVPIAGIGPDSNPDVVLAAMRAGARDFLVLRRDEADVAALLTKLVRRSTPMVRATQKQGKVFGVLSSHPNKEIAFVAEHIALGLIDQVGRAEPVLLVDMATPSGAAAIFLNINQSYSVLDAINDVYRWDQTLVDTAFAKHSSGLYLLGLPEDLVGRPQINFDEFVNLLNVARTLFSYVVVAFDGHMPVPSVASIINQADRTLLVTDQSIIRSRHNKYLLRALRLEDCALDRTALVVDNYRKRTGLEPENLAEILDLPVLGTLSASTGNNRIQSMNAGEPMYTIAPKDPFAIDARNLVAALAGGQAYMKPSTAGIFDRLFR